MQPRRLYVNTTDRTINKAVDTTPDQTGIDVFSEDVEPIELYFYETSTGAPLFLNYSANTVKLGVGVTAAAAVVTSWSAITTTVTASITALQDGGSGNNERQRITLSRIPQTGSFSIQFPSRNITISSITASTCLATSHGLFNGQTVSLTGFSGTPSGFTNGDSFFIRDRTSGSFRVATTPVGVPAAITATGSGTAVLSAINTPLIPAGATPAQVQAAIAAAGLAASGQSAIAVDGTSTEYTLNYGGYLAGINLASVTVGSNTLASAPGITANLNLATSAITALIAAGLGDSCKLEIEVSNGTLKQTYQAPATVKDDIIT